MGSDVVDISVASSVFKASTAASIVCGEIRGSSPCTFTMIELFRQRPGDFSDAVRSRAMGGRRHHRLSTACPNRIEDPLVIGRDDNSRNRSRFSTRSTV